ncbi:MAG: NfeD family protein [Alloprevotella sp.]|nr:NfeD family protein [Alloprevotella sp.]
MIEYFAENLWLLWVIVALGLMVLELSSGDFYFTCFAIGAACAALVSLTGVALWVQVIAWAIFALLSIWLVRPALKRWLHKGERERISNADAIVGRIVEVIEPIASGEYGRVKIDGDVWRAKTEDDSAVEAGQRVRIVRRESTIVVVSTTL